MGFLILYIISGVIFGLFTSHLAESKGYSSGIWFLLGFLFSLIALLVMVGMPKAQENPAYQKEQAAAVVLTEKDKRQNLLTWLLAVIIIIVGALVASMK